MPEHSDMGDLRGLLCVCSKRPSRRSTEKCNEIAPSHCLPRGSGRTSSRSNLHWKGPAHVRFWVKADICSANVMSTLPPLADIGPALVNGAIAGSQMCGPSDDEPSKLFAPFFLDEFCRNAIASANSAAFVIEEKPGIFFPNAGSSKELCPCGWRIHRSASLAGYRLRLTVS